jgi:hypothetical protein
MDWLDSIESMVSDVGKVRGRVREKIRKSRAVRARRP